MVKIIPSTDSNGTDTTVLDLKTRYITSPVLNRTTIAGLLYCNGLVIPNGTTGLVRANGTYDYNTYTTFTTIENSFLKKSDAVLTYLNKNDASFIYLTKTDANLYVLTSALNSTLNSYALNASLNNYVLTSAFNSTLSNYALNASLNNYVLTTAFNSTLNSYVLTTALNSALTPYLLKSGGTMVGDINMNTQKLLNCDTILVNVATTINHGYNNTISYNGAFSSAIGSQNTINGNHQIIVGNNSTVSSMYSQAFGGENMLNSSYGTGIGYANNISGGSYSNALGYSNIIMSNNCNSIGYNNLCSGAYSIAIGNDITNSTPNSCCIGDSAITQIYPNSLVCDLGNATKPFKDIYLSGEMKQSGLSKLDLQKIDSFFIGIQFQHGSGLLTNMSNSLWTALGSTSSGASAYALTNNFTRQLCCALWTTTGLADGAQCGYVSTSLTGIQVSTGFQWGLLSALGIADSTYNANNCQNFWGLWNVATGIPLNQATQLSVQRNMICFGSNTTDANICIYTAGATSTVKQLDLGSNFPSNRTNATLSTNFYRFSLFWDGTKIFYKAINTTLNVTVQGSFIPLTTDMPASSINLYPQCVRIMGTPQSNGQARLQVQRFGVFY